MIVIGSVPPPVPRSSPLAAGVVPVSSAASPTSSKPSPAGSASTGGSAPGPGWFAQTAEGQSHGPMGKEQLDQWVADGRLDEFCQIRRADWDHWKWIEEVYPQFRGEDESEAAPGALPVAPEVPKVEPCPDCGHVVSRRATQCPHCGCPLVARTVGSPARPAAGERQRQRRTRQTVILSLLGGLMLVILGVGGYLGYNLWQRAKAVVETVENVTAPLAPPPPVPPVDDGPVDDGKATPERMVAYKREVAAAKARQVDQTVATVHQNAALFEPVQGYSDAMQKLAGGDLDALDELDPASKNKSSKSKNKSGKSAAQAPATPKPYVSRFKALETDCMTFLDAQVPNDSGDLAAVQAAGEVWASQKQAEIPRQYIQSLQGQPSP